MHSYKLSSFKDIILKYEFCRELLVDVIFLENAQI